MNPADVCTEALPGNRIRELCRRARVYVCYSEGTVGDDPNECTCVGWMSCADVRNSNRAATLSLKGRVDFTCLLCCNETHIASDELVDPRCRTRFGEGFHVNSSWTRFQSSCQIW